MNKEKTCPACGMRWRDFCETTMLGCPNCYFVFEEELKPFLAETQGKFEHVGKTPVVTSVEYELIYEYNELLKKKEKAILDGNARAAATADKELKQLARELERRGLK